MFHRAVLGLPLLSLAMLCGMGCGARANVVCALCPEEDPTAPVVDSLEVTAPPTASSSPPTEDLAPMTAQEPPPPDPPPSTPEPMPDDLFERPQPVTNRPASEPPPTPEVEAACGADGVFRGDVRAATATDLLALEGCTRVEGDLQSSAIDLTALASLESVGGDLDINGAASLAGLERLTTVDGLHITETSLVDLEGLPSLTRISSGLLQIRDNPDLQSLRGLNAQLAATQLEVADNVRLEDWGELSPDGLQQLFVSRTPRLRAIPALGLGNVAAVVLTETGLTDLELLSGVRSVQTLVVSQCLDLSDASALQSLVEVELLRLEGTGLEDLSGVSALRTARDIIVSANPALEAFDGLTALESVVDVSIERNPVLTTPPQFPNLGSLRDLLVSTNAELLGAPELPLITEARRVRFLGNSSLLSITTLPTLQTADTLEVARNDVLSQLEFPALQEVTDLTRVVCNPALTADQIAWMDTVQGRRSDRQGNFGTTPCP